MFAKLLDSIRRTFTAHPHLFIVLISGMFGGILAAPIQALFRTNGNLTLFALPPLHLWQYTFFAVFGALAAGFSIYMAANSRREDLVHLFFFALSCGIGFPAVLLETQSKGAKDAQQKITSVDAIVADTKRVGLDKVAPAAVSTITTTVAQIPASQVDKQTQLIVADKASNIIQQLDSANTPAAIAAAQQIFEATRDAGYTQVQPPTVTVQTDGVSSQ